MRNILNKKTTANGKKAVSKVTWYVPMVILVALNIGLILWRGIDTVTAPSSEANLSTESSLQTGYDTFISSKPVPAIPAEESTSETNDECDDPHWCQIAMPSVSHFKFLPPPTDPKRWRKAQIQAAHGDQVLLREIVNQFPDKHDFLNGDTLFRPIQPLADVFVNDVTYFQQLTKDGHKILSEAEVLRENKRIGTILESRAPRKKHEKSYETMLNNVPYQTNWRAENKAPIVQLGYPTFNKVNGEYFKGTFSGGMYMYTPKIFEEWDAVRNQIDTPFIGISVLNENWGFLSTVFPGRVANWSICKCEKFPRTAQLLQEFLDHEKTLMLVVSQHHNQSHPKILTLPRGIPLHFPNTDQLVFDAMSYSLRNIKRTTLLFAAASSWGPSKFQNWYQYVFPSSSVCNCLFF